MSAVNLWEELPVIQQPVRPKPVAGPGGSPAMLSDLFAKIEIRDIRVAVVWLPRRVQTALGSLIRNGKLWGAVVRLSPTAKFIGVEGDDGHKARRAKRGTVSRCKAPERR